METIMTKTQALHNFFSGFGLPAYEETSVDTDKENMPKLPYLTYEVVTDSFDHDVALSMSVWYRSSSWTKINEKVEEISRAIGASGKVLRFDNGAIWIKRGQPFAQNIKEPSDSTIRRKYINLTANYICQN